MAFARLVRYITESLEDRGCVYEIGRLVEEINSRLRGKGFDFVGAEDKLTKGVFRKSSDQRMLAAVISSVVGERYRRPKHEESLGSRDFSSDNTKLPPVWGHIDDPATVIIETDPALIAQRERQKADWHRNMPPLSKEDRKIVKLRSTGQSIRAIALALDVSEATINRRLNVLRAAFSPILKELRDSRRVN